MSAPDGGIDLSAGDLAFAEPRNARAFVCGVTTDVCVHSTLRSAIDLGFECLVVEDCCAATVPSHHAAAIGTITTEGGIFGSVGTSASLCTIASDRHSPENG